MLLATDVPDKERLIEQAKYCESKVIENCFNLKRFEI